MQIQISWLLQKPNDLDLHCLQNQGISGFSRTRVELRFIYSEAIKKYTDFIFLNTGLCVIVFIKMFSWSFVSLQNATANSFAVIASEVMGP